MAQTDLSRTNQVFTPQALGQMNGLARRQATRAIQQTAVAGITAAAHEEARAYLTNAALQNVGALSALEEHLIQVAPLGAERYRHIVDAYALGVAQTIARW